jgi:DNA-binding MarR family transcriptional regulator
MYAINQLENKPMAESDTAPSLRLAAFLPYRLSVLSNTVSKRIADLYAAEFGLSMAQWRVMAVVAETAGLSATEIVTRTAMDKVAVSRAVASLIEMGHVKRKAAQDDGRRSLLFLTTKGKTAYRRIVPMAQAQERAATQALSQKEITELNRLLEKIGHTVSPDRALW